MNAPKIVYEGIKGAGKEVGRQLVEEAPAPVRGLARFTLSLKPAPPDRPRKRTRKGQPIVQQEDIDTPRW